MAFRTSLLVAVVGVLAGSAQAQVGRVYPSERKVINDAVTGVPLTVLTDGRVSDAKIYQTHPQWSADGKWIIFRTNGRAPGSQAYAVNEADGTIVQLTEGGGLISNSLNLTRKTNRLFFVRDREAHARPVEETTTAPTTNAATIRPTTGPATAPATTQATTRETSTHEFVELDLGRLLADAVAGKVEPAASYERVVGALPPGMRESGVGIDADESTAYFGISGGDAGKYLPAGVEPLPTPPGARMGAGPGGLRAMDLKTGALRVVIDTPFKVGHVQANPFVPGEILYCYETGGDATQRMWTVKGDGTGNRKLFVEGPDDWVTHEVVVGPDTVMFNLIGHQARLRKRPTGIATIDLRTDAVELLGQVDERQQSNLGDDARQPQNAAGNDSYGGFWHCNGSPDQRWAVGDTFTGNLWLIDRKTGERTLLSTDHKMKPDHTHPTFSDDSTRVLFQSGKWTDGQRLQLVVAPVPKAPTTRPAH
jgi:oligogalacturonide lyase